MFIKKIEVWETSDGARHSNHSMALQHVLNTEVIEIFTQHDYPAADAQDIVNLITGNIPKFREFLDACDKAEKEIMGIAK